MELGTGIFLSALFLGTVALFIATKDRWNWKKLLLWPLGVCAGLVVLGVAVGFVYKQYEARPQAMTALQGIKLGETLKDIAFQHGKVKSRSAVIREFLDSLKSEAASPRYLRMEAQYKKAKKEEEEALAKGSVDGEYWVDKTRVTFRNGRVEGVVYTCNSSSVDFTNANGIGCAEKGDAILEKFGSDVRVLCDKQPDEAEPESAARVYDVVKFGTRYILNKNTVVGIAIASPPTLDSFVGFRWDRCD